MCTDDDFDDLPDDVPAETLPCPECGADIYEESEQCPVCGAYVTFDRSVWSNRSPVWVILGLAGVIAVVAALILFG